MAAVTPNKSKALTDVIMHFFVNFVGGAGSDKSTHFKPFLRVKI